MSSSIYVARFGFDSTTIIQYVECLFVCLFVSLFVTLNVWIDTGGNKMVPLLFV